MAIVAKFRTFFEMIKFEHSIFALPFAYLGLVLAEGGLPRAEKFWWVTLVMVSFRTAGMSLNRLIDREIDAKNPRTENRALPAGRLSPVYVWTATIISLTIYFVGTYNLNMLCFKLSWIPLVFAYLYPWMKRFSWTCHFVLGLVLGIAPYGAWIASTGDFAWIPAFLTLGVVFWVAGFDIIYALQDLEFDRQSRLFSFPARFGEKVSLRVVSGLHVITILSWLIAGYLAQLGVIYYLGMAVVIGFLLRESWLIRSFGMGKVQQAFFQMNAVVSVVVFLSVLIDLMVSI